MRRGGLSRPGRLLLLWPCLLYWVLSLGLGQNLLLQLLLWQRDMCWWQQARQAQGPCLLLLQRLRQLVATWHVCVAVADGKAVVHWHLVCIVLLRQMRR